MNYTLTDIIGAIAVLDRNDLVALMLAIAARMAERRSEPVPPTGADQLLTVPQVAELLGYRPSYVYEMLKRGDLACVRDRKFVRVRKSALDAYIASREMRGPLPLKVSNVLSSRHDRSGSGKASQTAGVHPNRTREANRGARDNDLEVGNERGEDSETH